MTTGNGRNLRLERRASKHVEQELAKLSPDDRIRFEAIKVAADKCRDAAHAILDEQLDVVMGELLAHIDRGGSFAVLVVDPERMPVIPEASKLVKANGQPL